MKKILFPIITSGAQRVRGSTFLRYLSLQWASFSSLFAKKAFRLAYRIIFISFVVLWQSWFFKHTEKVPYDFQMSGAVGGGSYILDSYRNFLVFFNQYGLFPVGTIKKIENADLHEFPRWLKRNSKSLVNEIHEAYRSGDRGKIYLLWFDSLFRKSPLEAGYRYPGFLLFTVSLIVYFLGFSFSGKTGFASACVLLIGSNGFQLFEVYGNNNIFFVPISILLLVLGLNARWIVGKVEALGIKEVLAILSSGVVIGFSRHVRGEAAVLIVPLALLFGFYLKIPINKRILCVILFLSSFIGAQKGLEYRFRSSFVTAKNYVRNHGGHPYEGNMYNYHKIWHPIFCGLGDYGEDKGYKWDDLVAYRYALPQMRRILGDPDLWKSFSPENNPAGVLSSYYTDTYYDSAKIYRMKLEDLPVYEQVLKNKVIADIKEDPVWYLTILWKRIRYYFDRTTGLDLSLFGKSMHFEFKMLGWMILISVILGLLLRDGMYLKLTLISMCLAAPGILIYSGGNIRYYSIAHIFACLYLVKSIFKYSISAALNKAGGAGHSKP